MTHQRPSLTMTTTTTTMESTQQQQQQQQMPQLQRRPPDVEEALSSMLWTPYERTPTDSSSDDNDADDDDDDDDERLNKRLRRNDSRFHYRSLPATPCNSAYFDNGDARLLMQAAAASSSSSFLHNSKRNTPYRINIPAITPFVPFNDLLCNNSNNSSNRRRECTSTSSAALTPAPTHATVAIVQTIDGPTTIPPPPPPPPPRLFNYQFHHQRNQLLSKGSDAGKCAYDDGNGNGNGNGDIVSSNGSGSDVHNYRLSYTHFSQVPSLHKWWSKSSRVSINTMTSTSKEPPSYDSLYAEGHSKKIASVISATMTRATKATKATDNNENNQFVVETATDNNQIVNLPNDNLNTAASHQDCMVPYGGTAIAASNNNGTLKSCDLFGRKSKKSKDFDHQNNNSASKLNQNHLKSNVVMRDTKQNPHLTDQLPSGSQLWQWSNPYYGCEELNANAYAAPQDCNENTERTSFTTDSLIPNKCLAELERLYAEFRASESLIERQLNAAFCTDSDIVNSAGCKTITPKTTGGDKMRLNIPASENITNANSIINPVKAGSTSSVFLTTTNSVTSNSASACGGSYNGNAIVSSPSANNKNHNNNNNLLNENSQNLGLTIQVNEKSPNFLALHQTQQPQRQDRQDISQDSVVQKNGVSVINCSYNNNNNNINNNNNDNKLKQNYENFASNNNCDQDNNNFVASSVINHSSSGGSASIGCHSSVPQSCNVVNKQNDAISGNCENSVGSSGGQSQYNIDIVKNFVNNNRKVNRATATTSTSTANDDHSVHIINVNNSPVNAPNYSNTAITKANSGNHKAPPATTAPSPSHRTFTSTECQTDDILPAAASNDDEQRAATRHGPAASTAAAAANNTREQRRRERRERRQQQQQLLAQQQQQQQQALRRPLGERHSMPASVMQHAIATHLHPAIHMHPHANPNNATMPAAMSAILRPMLPDLLHSHYPPPYSALPLPANCSSGPMSVNMLPPPATSLLGHSPNGSAIATALPPPPPPGATILTPVISTVPIPGATPIVGGDGRFTLPLPIMRRSPSERSRKGCCGQWFAGPPLRALIAVVALGGVACALGGAALGATGLAGPPSSHLTAALLMIGVGVVLVTVSGAAWRMTAPGHTPCLGFGSSVDLGRCGRRPCSRGGGASHGLLYPEFQHRPPPPSYQASMQEYRLRLLLLDRDRQSGVVRGSSPPPTYRSHAGSLLRAPLTTTSRIGGGVGGGSSSIAGSEYSFPPSYRSRNITATPATICSERSIETAPSGRLLANEDIPEPLSVEQLSEYNSTQNGNNRRKAMTTASAATTTTTTTKKATPQSRADSRYNELRTTTTGIVEVEASAPLPTSTTGAPSALSDGNRNVAKLNPRVSTSKEIFNGSTSILTTGSSTSSSTLTSMSPANCKELVTIVTISQPISALTASGSHHDSNNNSNNNNNHAVAASSTDHIEILAHL